MTILSRESRLVWFWRTQSPRRSLDPQEFLKLRRFTYYRWPLYRWTNYPSRFTSMSQTCIFSFFYLLQFCRVIVDRVLCAPGLITRFCTRRVFRGFIVDGASVRWYPLDRGSLYICLSPITSLTSIFLFLLPLVIWLYVALYSMVSAVIICIEFGFLSGSAFCQYKVGMSCGLFDRRWLFCVLHRSSLCTIYDTCYHLTIRA